jgi:thiosulfate/3-mercaptopyruvate sulfurtransferase
MTIALAYVHAEARPPDADPWTAADLVEASQLAAEMAHAQGKAGPTILYVGFRTLFAGGHIPGSSFHGTASTEQGLADLKKFAATLARDTDLIIYCGCCPFDHCPNIRPAFVALHGMGFTHLRVLVLPKSFATDWVDKGYPVEKGL